MRKADLINAVAGQTNENRKLVETCINTALSVIMDAVASGDKVTLTGFGSFEARHRKERTGRNPQTGEPMKIAATVSPAFKAGKDFTDRVKSGQ